MRIGSPVLGNASIMAGLMQGMAQTGIRGQQEDMENKKLQQARDQAAAALALQAELGRRGADQGDARLGLDRDQFGAAQNQFAQKLAEDQRQFNTGDANTDAALAQRALEFQQAQAQQGGQFNADLGLRSQGLGLQARGEDRADRAQTFHEKDVGAGRAFAKGMQGDQIRAQAALENLMSQNRRGEAADNVDMQQILEQNRLAEGSPQEKAAIRSERRAADIKKEEQGQMIAGQAENTKLVVSTDLAKNAINQSVELAKAAMASNDHMQGQAFALASKAAPEVAAYMTQIQKDPAAKAEFVAWAQANHIPLADPTGKALDNALRQYAVAALGYDQTVGNILRAFGHPK